VDKAVLNNVLEARVVISPDRGKVIINLARDNRARKAHPDRVNTVLISGHNGRARVDLSVPAARAVLNLVTVKVPNGQARDRIDPAFLVTALPARVNTVQEQALG
jgi:hypothetical protein